MYQSSISFGELIQQDSRTFQAQITLGEHSITKGIKIITLNGGSNSEDDFSIGSAVSQYVEITMSIPEFLVEGHEFLLEIGMDVNGTPEYVPMGYFTAEKPDSDEEQITFTAYDRMMKTECPCFLELPDTTDTVAVLNAISTIVGVTVVTTGLNAITMQKPVGYTCREVLSYIAQIYGGFAICNRSGKIEIRTYQDNGYTVPTNRYWGAFSHNNVPFLLEKLTCYTGKDVDGNDISIGAGTGVREISFSNPFMTQAMLDDVWEKLQNYTYMPGSFTFLGDPRIDPWDILTVEDRNGASYKVPAMKLTQKFDGGLSTTAEAVGRSEVEQSSGFHGPQTKQMDRYYAQLVVIDHALVNKIDTDVVEANYVKSIRFEGLQADFEDTKTKYLEFESATGNDLTLIHGNIQTIEGDFASYKKMVAGDFAATNATITNLSGELSTYKQTVTGQLTAFDADITNLKAKDAELEKAVIGKASVGDLEAVRTKTSQLEADYSKLNTLVNGNLTSDNIHSLTLNSKNTTIENGMIKNAMIESLAFDKITGIDVNTTKLTVHSDDGKSTWRDNTIQIADANRVRVQMGKDASGDYTLAVWDAEGKLIWDALGATENTIQRKIIRDDVVADDAAISGSKLDIESVVKEVNGATTKLKSTTILLDDKNQTLDVVFNEMESTVSENSEKLSTHTTSISTMQGQISSLIAEDTTIKGNYDALVSRYNSTVKTVDSIKTTIGEHTTLLDSQSEQILAMQSKENTIESDLSGTKQTVSSIQSNLESTTSRVTTVETGLDGLKTRVSNTETALKKKADGTTVDSLTSRVSTCETTLDGFETSLTATNKTVSDNYASLKNYTDSAKSSAISTAASDASTKANNALASAKSYAEGQASTALSNAKNYTDAGIGGIQVGGRNLLSGTSSEWKAVSCDKYRARIPETSSEINPSDYGLQVGDTVTLGFYVKTTSGKKLRARIEFFNSSSDRTSVCGEDYVENGEGYVYVTTVLRDGYSKIGLWVDAGLTMNTITSTTTEYVKCVMFEKASKPSNWQPSPEDTQSQIDLTNATVATHTEQISSHDTRITAAENAISLKVSTSDFTSYKTTVTGQISTAKTEAINAAASDATTKANNAKSAAISAAASDATTKANNALADAKADATTKANNALSDAKSDATTKANNALKDAKAYTTAQITTVNEHLTTTDQTISVMQGQIALKVEQTDIDTSIRNMSIGTGNILYNSTGLRGTDGWRYTSTSFVANRIQGRPGLTKYGLKLGNSNTTEKFAFSKRFYLKPSTTYTLSGYMNVDVNAKSADIFVLTSTTIDNETDTTSGYDEAFGYYLTEKSKWVYFSKTFTTPKETKSGIVRLDNNGAVTSGTEGFCYFEDLMLVEGNKAVSWAPSSKDTEAEFANYSTTTQMQAAITASKDSITQSVSATYATRLQLSQAEGNITKLDSRVQTAESKLTKDGLTTIVGDYYTTATVVNNKIGGIQVGGRNYYLNSAKEFTLTYTSSAVHYQINLSEAFSMLGDNSFLVSFDAKSDTDGLILEATLREYSNNNIISNAVKTALSTSYKRYNVTLKLQSGYTASDVARGFFSLRLAGNVYIKNAKIEVGNKATDWTPAPEDTDSSIASVKTIAEQTSNQFKWIVKSGTAESNMVLTDTLYNLVAENINLTGKVTFSCLDSAAQQKITTAQSTADSAKTAAANAQSTADTAKSNAATAQSTANTAKKNAATAQSTADTAKSNAATAQSTANTANSTAGAVKSTVDAGKSNWDSAYSWTSSNGSNMTSLLSMVKKWTNNAVSDTTTIQGGWIATNTITADKIAIGDFTNYSDLTTDTASKYGFTVVQDSSASNNPWLQLNNLQRDTSLCPNTYKNYKCNGGESFRIKFQVSSTVKGLKTSSSTSTEYLNINIGLYGRTDTGTNIWCIPTGATSDANGTVKTVNVTTSLPSSCRTFSVALQISGTKSFSGVCKVRNISVTKMSSGELIVDGAITTDKLAANSVTAAKINTTDLFAQDITATGSITGVTLNGATVNSTSGNIGGWEIESGALKSGGDTYNFSGSTIINQMTTSQITKRGVYLNASAGMARFVNCESNYKESAGMYFNTVRETRIVGGTTTGYKATYDYLYSNNFASFSGDVTVEDWSGTLRKPVTSINNSQYCVSHFQSNSSSLTVTGAWAGSELSSRSITVTSSDIRLKENIRQTEVEALPIINQIGLYQFDWKQDGLHQKIGFIADYLEQQDEHFSVGGGYDDDGIMNVKAVDNFYLMGYVVKGMQELSTISTRADTRLRDVEVIARSTQSETESLKSEMNSLRYQLEQAYIRIATLEKQLQAVG